MQKRTCHSHSKKPFAAVPAPFRRSMGQLLRDLGPVIYYVRLGGLIKIGYTADLDQRIRAYGPTVKLLAWRMGGSFEQEREIHESLRAHRARGREWYFPTPEVVAVVNQARIDCGIHRIVNA